MAAAGSAESRTRSRTTPKEMLLFACIMAVITYAVWGAYCFSTGRDTAGAVAQAAEFESADPTAVASVPLAEAAPDASMLEGLRPKTALVWHPSGQLVVNDNGEVVLEGAEILLTGQQYFIEVPETELPLQLGIVGRFSVVKPDAEPSSLGVQTGQIALYGSGEGRYKLFPVDDDGRRTVEPPTYICIIVVGEGDLEYWSSDLKKTERAD